MTGSEKTDSERKVQIGPGTPVVLLMTRSDATMYMEHADDLFSYVGHPKHLCILINAVFPKRRGTKRMVFLNHFETNCVIQIF